MITKPGIYGAIPESEYHSDPCPEPSLSKSVMAILLDQSPRHAWTAHPRLNPQSVSEDKTIYDLGTVAHAVLLGGGSAVAVLDFKDFKTNAAKEARDAARAEGKTPILAEKYEDVKAMCEAAVAQTKQQADCGTFIVPHGKSEQTVIWREGDIWCRIRVDWLPDSGPIFYDFKTTGAGANPDAWSRRAFDQSLELQAGFYCRGLRAAGWHDSPEIRFVVQENKPPYAVCVIGMGERAMELAHHRVEAGIKLWTQCMAEDRWPGYPSETAWIEPPPWVENDWEARQVREEAARRDGLNLFAEALDWQRPL